MIKTYKAILLPSLTGVFINKCDGLDTCFNHGFEEYNPLNNFQHVNLMSLYIVPIDYDEDYNKLPFYTMEGYDFFLSKVIASTDSKLKSGYPKISINIIKDYVKSYNEHNQILFFDVEMENINDLIPKIDNDGNIIIHVHKKYSLEEVFSLCHEAYYRHETKYKGIPFEEWFEDTMKKSIK